MAVYKPDPSLYKKHNKQIFSIIYTTLYILVLGLVAYFSLKNGIRKIKTQDEQISKLNGEKVVLEEKLKILKENQSLVGESVSKLSLALPPKNPVLYYLIQFKDLKANTTDVNMTDYKITSNGADIKYGVTGEISKVADFIRKTTTIAPLLTISKISLNFLDADLDASIDAAGHYAAFPENIPDITTPLEKVTQEDMKTLQVLSALIYPSFNIMTSTGPFDRSNPFGL